MIRSIYRFYKELFEIAAFIAGVILFFAAIGAVIHLSQHATGTCGGNCVHCP